MTDSACDRAFDLLTRAEPLVAADQAALDAHLSCCPTCREVAHAWAPALELLSVAGHAVPAAETLVDVATRQEVEAWQQVEVEATRAAEREANLSRWYGPLSLAAAVLFGCVLGGVWQMAQVRPAGLMAQTVGDARFDGLAIESLPMIEACWSTALPERTSAALPSEPGAILAAAARPTHLADVKCCTYCHAAGRNSLTRLAQIEQSCRVCHLAMR